MPSYVLKASQDESEDLYGIYSTIVDAFTFVGTREEIHTEFTGRGRHPMEVNALIAHADALGSSCGIADDHFQIWYGWAEKTINIGEGPGSGELSRKDLVAYLRAIEAHNLDAAAALVMPDVDEDEHRVEWEAHLADLGPISPRQGSYIVDTGATTLSCACGWSWMGPSAEAETVAAEHEGATQ